MTSKSELFLTILAGEQPRRRGAATFHQSSNRWGHTAYAETSKRFSISRRTRQLRSIRHSLSQLV